MDEYLAICKGVMQIYTIGLVASIPIAITGHFLEHYVNKDKCSALTNIKRIVTGSKDITSLL